MLKSGQGPRPKEIHKFRVRLRLSQTEFAKILFTTKDTIRLWESGKLTPTDIPARTLRKLMQKLEKKAGPTNRQKKINN